MLISQINWPANFLYLQMFFGISFSSKGHDVERQAANHINSRPLASLDSSRESSDITEPWIQHHRIQSSSLEPVNGSKFTMSTSVTPTSGAHLPEKRLSLGSLPENNCNPGDPSPWHVKCQRLRILCISVLKTPSVSLNQWTGHVPIKSGSEGGVA